MKDGPGNPGASPDDIAHCEAAIGVAFPDWLRARLLAENGWPIDDTAGVTRTQWRFLPVLDRSDRKRRSRTAEDIAWHTRRLREGVAALNGAVVVARAYSEVTRLILLPDPAVPDRLGVQLWRQNGVGAPLAPSIDTDTLGRMPKPAPDSRVRPREELPVFRYHPDPVATGSIVENTTTVCPCCEKLTGWAYVTQPYGLGDQPDHLCPWCIADGSAAKRFGSEFVPDMEDLEIPKEVIDEVGLRTPGYLSWQQERWQSCCGDAALFLGRIGWDRLRALPDAQATLLEEGWSEDVLPMMHADGDPTAYLFRCRHCGRHLAHADAS